MSPDVEIEINISSGASDLDLDLRNLNVRKLSIDAGAADIRVHLPTNAGETHVDINAGAANTDLIVPQDVAASIEIEVPIRSTSFDPMRFTETNNGYESPNYHNATNRINITIRLSPLRRRQHRLTRRGEPSWSPGDGRQPTPCRNTYPGVSPIQTSPPSKYSFFQIGTTSFNRSMK